MKGFFVTGTDTGIGKTLTAAALLHALGAAGKRVAGMKPVAAGCSRDGAYWHNEDVAMHAAASNVAIANELRCPYPLAAAASPHIAAALENVRIDIRHIEDCAARIAATVDLIVVEGVGGFRVPLGDTHDTTDLAVALDLPVILVVGMRLGCLNHALLTAQAVAHSGLTLAGWVANSVEPAMPYFAANLATLQELLLAPLLGTIPHLVPATAAAASAHLHLAPLLPP